MSTYASVLITILTYSLIIVEICLIYGEHLQNNPKKVKYDGMNNILLVDKQEVIRKYLFKRDCFVNFNNYKINKLATLLIKYDRDSLNKKQELQLLMLLQDFKIELSSFIAFESELEIKKYNKRKNFKKRNLTNEQKNFKY